MHEHYPRYGFVIGLYLRFESTLHALGPTGLRHSLQNVSISSLGSVLGWAVFQGKRDMRVPTGVFRLLDHAKSPITPLDLCRESSYQWLCRVGIPVFHFLASMCFSSATSASPLRYVFEPCG